MLLGALVAGETLHIASFIGIALVLLGAFLASRGKPSPKTVTATDADAETDAAPKMVAAPKTDVQVESVRRPSRGRSRANSRTARPD